MNEASCGWMDPLKTGSSVHFVRKILMVRTWCLGMFSKDGNEEFEERRHEEVDSSIDHYPPKGRRKC